MRPGTKLFVFTSLAFAAGIAVTLGLQRVYDAGGFLKDSLDHAFDPPHTPTKTLFMVAATAIFLALPIAIAEWASTSRFRRRERELRETRPADDVNPYEGPEGRGLLFDGPDGRLLLAEPRGGIGAPVEIPMPPLPPPEPAPVAEAPPAADPEPAK